MRKKVNKVVGSPDLLGTKNIKTDVSKDTKAEEVFAELTRGVHAALETYSNVHQGSGHNSIVSTH